MKLPPELTDLPQWVVWKTTERHGKPTKVPFRVTGSDAKSNDPATWGAFDQATAAVDPLGMEGVGFVFSEADEFCGVDLDGCRDPETGKVAEWAKEVIMRFATYAEVSPSGTGVKLFCRGESPFDTGKNLKLDFPAMGGKAAGIEVYDKLRYFAVTGRRLKGMPLVCEPCQGDLDWLKAKFWQPRTLPPLRTSDGDVVERARKYMLRVEPAVSGQGGHNQAFRAACVLVCDFGLSRSDAKALLTEWNQTCLPPWSEREIDHKLDDAAKQPITCKLRDATQETLDRTPPPKHEPPKAKPATRITTMKDAAGKYLDSIRGGQKPLFATGISELDAAIGGGMDAGEMVVIAARPSHGKTAVALQMLHHSTFVGIPSLFISEEMSALALGKRAIQFASDTPTEYWHSSIAGVERIVGKHFAERAPLYIAESSGTAERAAEIVRDHVANHGVKVVAVDYAQLLSSKGNGRYEQTTATSIALRQVASETKCVLVVLCQLNRAIEKRDTFQPMMSDIKDTGQFEQDADVMLITCWPHRLNNKNDPKQYQFFVVKNRNRPIVTPAFDCVFNPSRQMITGPEIKDHRNYVSDFDAYNAGAEGF